MSFICPSDGHVIEYPKGDFCEDHGVRWFVPCPACGAPWPVVPIRRVRTSLPRVTLGTHENPPSKGSDFCAGCGMPGPWVSRPQLIQWIQQQTQADRDIPPATRQELLAVMERLQELAPNDTKAVPGWERIRKDAPKVWEAMKPVRDTLIGEAVKKLLGL